MGERLLIDILFVAWNRRAMTEASFEALLANTDWSQVSTLHVHDDASEDGTNRYLQDALERVPARIRYESQPTRSPVAVMSRYLELGGADWFAKIDNDSCVPPGWVDALLSVRDSNDVDVIGMEAGMTAVADRNEPWDGVYRLEPCTHIGGIGLIRAGAFTRRMVANGRYGFGDYQRQHRLKRGWITPDLPLVLLDRLPFEPWLSLSAEYVEKGWQRPWPTWDPVWMAWAWSWFAPEQVPA